MQLTEQSQKIALGEYAPLSTRTSYQEVDELAHGFIRMIQAIHDREESLKTSERVLNSVIEQSPYSTWISDNNGTMLRMNNACRELLHITDDEVVGKYNVLNDNIVREQGMLPQVKTVFEERKPARFILEYDSAQLNQIDLRSPTSRILDVTIFPITDSRGRLTNAVIQHRDITDQRRAEDALKAYSDQLEEMVAARTRELQQAQEQLVRHEKLAVLGQMAGSVGHELRSPLATISNAVYYLNMVLDKPGEEIAEYLEIVASETRNAEKIITDLLDFSRIKSLDRQDIRVAEVVALVLAKHAAPKTVRVTTDIPDGLPAIVADPTHLEQVLANLVTNACQAMPEGGTLTISARLENRMVSMGISDTGAGIAPDNMDKLFEPLFTTKPKGIGLGLAVCKNLVEANGGSIDAESETGKGTTFTVMLPVPEESS
jgi:PAS domain S-box-containing protein